MATTHTSREKENSNAEPAATFRSEDDAVEESGAPLSYPPTDSEIAARAYEYWQQRGSAHGSPELDWFRAEQDLQQAYQERARTGSKAKSAATSA